MVPSSTDFEVAVEDFEQAVQQEIEAGAVSGALIYGSVAIQACTLRSDFDCMIVPYDHSSASLAAISRVLATANPHRRIDMSAIIHPKARLEKGAHEIDRYFGDHLTGPSRIVFGEDPATYMRFPEQEAFACLLAYVRHKKRSVATGLLGEGPDRYKGLQRILELPLAIGRKTLRVLDEVHGSHYATADSANKACVTPAALTLFDAFGLGETPRAIIRLDRWYSNTLLETLAGAASDDEYRQVLAEITAHGRYAGEWLDRLDEALVEYAADVHEEVSQTERLVQG